MTNTRSGASEKQRRLTWYWHVMRMDDEGMLEESVDDGYTREKRPTENKMETRVPTRYENTGLRASTADPT